MEHPEDPVPPAEPVDDSAYARIRGLIASGDLEQGSWLRETALAERLGVSRTPIREALNRLAAEGIVEMSRNKGAQVVSFSGKDVADLYDVRAGFEPHAALLAVPRLSDADVERLAVLAGEMEEAAAAGSLETLSALNNEFHGMFVERCGNRHFAAALQTLMRPAVVAHTFNRYSPEALQRSMSHHAELVAAARAGDGEWAEAVMRTHILAARNAAGARQPAASSALP